MRRATNSVRANNRRHREKRSVSCLYIFKIKMTCRVNIGNINWNIVGNGVSIGIEGQSGQTIR